MGILRPSKLQFSCTTLQYEFAKEQLPEILEKLKQFQFNVKENEQGYLVSRAIEAELNADEDVYLCYEEGGRSFGRSIDLDGDSGPEEKPITKYQVPNAFDEALDCLRLSFLAADMHAGTVMNFGDPTNRLAALDWTVSNVRADWLFFDITERCDLGCEFCYQPEHGIKDVSMEKFEEILKKKSDDIEEENSNSKFPLKKELGVTLGGGEPTQHPNLPQLLDIAAQYSEHVTLSTNSTNTDVLIENRKLLDGVAVSAPFVYAPDRVPIKHKLGYDAIKENIQKLKDHIERICISTIVTSKMEPDDVYKVEEFAKESGASDILFLLYKPGQKDLVPDKERARKILENILSLDFRSIHPSIDVCYAKHAANFHCRGVLYADASGNLSKDICSYPEKYCE
jgi:MoaA/NifB/PqqE/SkfB family radical SAM enzyme